MKRRDFLQRSSLISLAPLLPTVISRTARAAESEDDDRILVVMQLNGGNDGLNTLIPYADKIMQSTAKCCASPKTVF